MDFWDYHGIFFLICIYYFPRITMLFATSVSFGLLAFFGWIFTPYILAAVYATIYYWSSNPLLCIIAWFIAVNQTNKSLEKINRISKKKRLTRGHSKCYFYQINKINYEPYQPKPRKMKTKTTLIFLSLFIIMGLMIAPLSGCKKQTNEVEYLASGHPAWWPIMYQSNDLIVGAGPEIIAKIFSDLGLKISFKYVGPWDVVQEKAKSGEVDLLVAAYKTPERETYMDYSIPYTIDPVSIFVKKGKSFPFNSWSELIPKKGVVTVGDSYGQEFDQYIKDSLNVVTVATPDEAFALLDNGQADYFVYALYSGKKAIANQNLKEKIEILPKYVSSENFYLTISKKSALVAYLPQINQLLEKYIADGTIDQIIAKHNVY